MATTSCRCECVRLRGMTPWRPRRGRRDLTGRQVEFAAERYGTRLVVVMGHTRCGAVEATLEVLEGSTPLSSNVMSIVERVRPSLEAVRESAPATDRQALLRATGRANVRVAADHLRHGSPVLERFIQHDGLLVLGAEYDVESGRIDFFDLPLQVAAEGATGHPGPAP